MEMKEEEHFVIHMMKFIFQISGCRLPPNLQELLLQYPLEEPSNFNENITKAVLILINDVLSTKEFPPDIGSTDFDNTVRDLQRSYTPLKFLKFCSSYGLKAVIEYKERKSESPTEIYEAIMWIFESTKENGLFTEESWDDLRKIASKIVTDDKEMCMQVQKVSKDMSSEREFILRAMDYIFSLYFKDMPVYLIGQLIELEDHEDNPFTPTISHALTCLMNNQMEVILNIGVDGIEKYFYESVLKSYNERDFLELCVCYFRKAVLDYYEEDEYYSPLIVYGTLLDIFRHAKEGNMLTSWKKMDNAAALIVEEDLERTESELEYLILLSRSKSKRAELEEHTPLIRVNEDPLIQVNEDPQISVSEAESLLISEQVHKRSCDCCKCS